MKAILINNVEITENTTPPLKSKYTLGLNNNSWITIDLNNINDLRDALEMLVRQINRELIR